MRRIYISIILILVILAGINYVYINRFRNSQLEFHREILLNQTRLAGSQIESTIKDYENDLNKIIFKNINEIYGIFTNEKSMDYIIEDLKYFYAKYRNLISKISVYDNENNFLGFYINDRDEFVIDTFSRQQDNQLEPHDTIISSRSNYLSYFPFFEINDLKGNIVVEIDLGNYLSDFFDLFRTEGVQWMWLMDTSSQVIYSGSRDDFTLSDTELIADSIAYEAIGLIEHTQVLHDRSTSILSAYYPLNIIRNDLGVVLSLHIGDIMNVFVNKNIILGLINLGVFLVIIFILISKVVADHEKQREYQSKMLELRMIVEHFPIGVMVRGKHGIIRLLNKTGQKLLFTQKDEDLIGRKFDEKSLRSNKYLLDDSIGSQLGADHLMHYFREGNEIVVYMKDEVKQIAGEEVTLSALIDVSSMERSRKQEAAANLAKSDFLARMSHEIRTPMNGIIGMVESLMLGEITGEQKEKVEIIKKSAELLMAVINDILDFSKIEAGKMLLEEIPFTLSEELKISMELFKPLAEEKGLNLDYKIANGVPEHLIGDPFRLRQVISNILSNAIKFTQEGRILVSVELVDVTHYGMNILFTIEDTGMGIPKDKLDSIFKGYEQAGGSTSRKFGGTGLGMTISKQLVEMMHGEIFVESPSSISVSSEYPGSKFSFTVELHSDEKLDKDFDYSRITDLNMITALILNRQKDDTDNIHRVFDSFGVSYKYREYNYDNIDGVIYHIEQKKDLYQFIIINDKPNYDGFAMALQLFENGISTKFPIIFISSNDKPGNYRKCKSLGVDYYLVQPFDSHEVYNILKENLPSIGDIGEKSGTINKIRTNLNVLVAEDNIINQRVVQALFKQLGYEIDVVENGNQVLDEMSKKHYDLILMDLIMPEYDGISATKDIRKKGDNTTIIAMTASNEDEKREEAFKAGMNDYAIKPVSLEALKGLLIKWFSETI